MNLREHQELDLREPANPAALEAAQSALGSYLPDGYADFLRHSDGADGFIGENIALFYGVDELLTSWREHADDWVMAGRLVFGTNRGGEAFVFDEHGQVWMIPFIAAPDDGIPQGSFEDFVRRLHDDTIFDR